MIRVLRNLREEGAAFRAAVAAAPEPRTRRPLPRVLRLLYRIGWCLLHEHGEPGPLALAVFIGVIIGTSPFYGLHLLLCVLFAMALRLNKLAMWLAANVSLPIFAPFLGFASVQAGHFMLRGDFAGLSPEDVRAARLLDLMLYWLVGFPLVGAALGAVLAGIVWRVALRRRAARVAAELPTIGT